MEKLRTFVAVEVGEAIKKRFGALEEELKQAGAGVRWVEVGNAHVTLKFLGHVDYTDIPQVDDVIHGAVTGLEPFCIKFRGVGAFPKLERPRVIFAGIQDGSGGLARINAGLEQGFSEKLGIKKEGRRFSPHLTLGRVRSQKGIATLVELMGRHSADDFGEELVMSVVLMQSQLSSKGPTYIKLNSFDLE